MLIFSPTLGLLMCSPWDGMLIYFPRHGMLIYSPRLGMLIYSPRLGMLIYSHQCGKLICSPRLGMLIYSPRCGKLICSHWLRMLQCSTKMLTCLPRHGLLTNMSIIETQNIPLLSVCIEILHYDAYNSAYTIVTIVHVRSSQMAMLHSCQAVSTIYQLYIAHHCFSSCV